MNLLKEEYMKKYAFLNMSEEEWNQLLDPLSRFITHDNMNINCIKSLVDTHLEYQINSKICMGDTHIISNLLSMIDNSLSDTDTLKMFLELLNHYHIIFNEDYYLKMKRELPLFYSLLERLGYQDISFEELKKKGLQENKLKRKSKKNLYDYFKKEGEELSFEDKQIVDFLFSRLPIARQRKIKRYLRVEESQTWGTSNDILLLQRNFENFKKQGFSSSLFVGTIYKYFIQLNVLFTKEDKELIDILFAQLSKEKQERISNYLKHLYSFNDEEGKKCFNDIRYLRVKFMKCKKLGYIPTSYFRSIYKYFVKDDEIISEEDKAIVDLLFAKLSKEHQDEIISYMDKEYSQKGAMGNDVPRMISLMQAKFKKYKQNMQSINKLERTLYSYFEDESDPLSKKDKEVIDLLFSKLSKIRQEGIKGYIIGKYGSTGSIGKKAYNDIVLLQQQFKRYRIKGSFEKTIYDYFKTEKGFLTESEKELIDGLFAVFPKEYQEGILGYMEGIYHKNSEIGKRAYNDIRWMQRQFSKCEMEGYTFDYIKRKLYLQFTYIKEKLSDVDKLVIHSLFMRLSYEKRENIINYINGKLCCGQSSYHQGQKDINMLRRQFKDYLKSGKIPVLKNHVSLYDFFRSIKGDLTDEDKQVIDHLFNALTMESQEIITNYIHGKYKNGDAFYNKANMDLGMLQQQFNKIQVLLDALKVVEEQFYRLGYSCEEFRIYQEELEQEIRNRGVTSELELMSAFINESYQFIKENEGRRL